MYHKGFDYDMLMNMDITVFGELIERINESNTGLSKPSDRQIEMVNKVKQKS